MKSEIDRPISVHVSDRASMENQLEQAVAIARNQATQEGVRGILVTRHDYNAFTVTLSDDVPYGLTREYQDW